MLRVNEQLKLKWRAYDVCKCNGENAIAVTF